jgi:hypothetical protein
MPSTSVRIDRTTHEELKRLAEGLGKTVGETVALAVRRLRQERVGRELTAPLSQEEIEWLPHQIRAVSAARVVTVRGNVGAAALHHIRETIALVLETEP